MEDKRKLELQRIASSEALATEEVNARGSKSLPRSMGLRDCGSRA